MPPQRSNTSFERFPLSVRAFLSCLRRRAKSHRSLEFWPMSHKPIAPLELLRWRVSGIQLSHDDV
jgi:hypothetical protein